MAEMPPRPRRRSDRARAKKPGVTIDVRLDIKGDGRSGNGNGPRYEPVDPRKRCRFCFVPSCATTSSLPTSSRGRTRKSLVARFPARQTKFEFIDLRASARLAPVSVCDRADLDSA